MNTGIQKATIVKAFVGETETKGTLFVNVVLAIEEETAYAKVYITEKSYGIARAALKKCGFDPDTQELSDIENDPTLLAGNEVEVNVYDDPPYGLKVEIVTDRPKAPADKLKAASMGLRNAKKKSATPSEPEGVPF